MGLKNKLRNDNWSDSYIINKVISDLNIEINLPEGKRKVVNVNNEKHKERERFNQEVIRTFPTRTFYGRVSRPRYIAKKGNFNTCGEKKKN